MCISVVVKSFSFYRTKYQIAACFNFFRAGVRTLFFASCCCSISAIYWRIRYELLYFSPIFQHRSTDSTGRTVILKVFNREMRGKKSEKNRGKANLSTRDCAGKQDDGTVLYGGSTVRWLFFFVLQKSGWVDTRWSRNIQPPTHIHTYTVTHSDGLGAGQRRLPFASSGSELCSSGLWLVCFFLYLSTFLMCFLLLFCFAKLLGHLF